jgi:archaellum component FlaD/FlaE
MATESGKTESASTGNASKETPEQIEAEIEATREDLGDTVAELADKADVKKQAKKKVTQTKAKATAKKEDAMEAATTKEEEEGGRQAQQATPNSAAVAGEQAIAAARGNPVPLAVGGAFAAGFVVAWMLRR